MYILLINIYVRLSQVLKLIEMIEVYYVSVPYAIKISFVFCIGRLVKVSLIFYNREYLHNFELFVSEQEMF